MKKSQRIKMLVGLQEEKEKEALKKLGLSQQRYNDLLVQTDNLKKYRQEYQANFNSVSADGVKIAQILEYKSFIEKLDRAIAGQERQLFQSKEELGLKRQNWEHTHFKLNGLQKMLNSASAHDIKLELLNEQKEQDERASRFDRNIEGGMENV